MQHAIKAASTLASTARAAAKRTATEADTVAAASASSASASASATPPSDSPRQQNGGGDGARVDPASRAIVEGFPTYLDIGAIKKALRKEGIVRLASRSLPPLHINGPCAEQREGGFALIPTEPQISLFVVCGEETQENLSPLLSLIGL
jgi:hypothetical protein